MKRLLLKIRRALPPFTLSVIILSGICWLTLVPDPTPGIEVELFLGADKVVHAIMFFALAAAIYSDSQPRFPKYRYLKMAVISSVISMLTGVIIECLQLWMNIGRSFETADIVADAAGAFILPLALCVAKKCR